MPDNEKKLRAAGLRMAIKLIPDNLMQQAPATLEKYLLDQMTNVEPEENEAGTCYVIAPDDHDGGLRIMLCTMDEHCAISRIIKRTTLSDLFTQIINGMKEL